MTTYRDKKPKGLINAETKLRYITADNKRLKEEVDFMQKERWEFIQEIEALQSERQDNSPMYSEGVDFVVKQVEVAERELKEFKKEMRSFRKWIKWRWKQ